MEVLAEIRQKLLSGMQPVDLVKAGYAKSSVYYVARKVRDAQLGMLGLPLGDELAELRRRREIIKLEKEIADLEAAKEKLPARVAALEKRLDWLTLVVRGVGNTCITNLRCVLWKVYPNGIPKEVFQRAKEISEHWVEKEVEPDIGKP